MKSSTFFQVWLSALACCAALAAPAAGQNGSLDKNLPDGLRHVPPDAMAFVHLRVGDFVKSNIGRSLLDEFGKDKYAAKGLQEMEKYTSIPLAELESVTLLLMGPPGLGGLSEHKRAVMEREHMEKAIMMEREKAILRQKEVEELLKRELMLRIEREVELQKLKELERKQKELDPKNEKFFEPVSQNDGPIHVEESRGPGKEPRHDPHLEAIMGWEPMFIFTGSKPLNRKQLLKIFTGLGDHDGGKGFDRHRRGGATILFLSERSFLLGAPRDLVRYAHHVARKTDAKKPAPLAMALAMGTKKKVLVAGGHVPDGLLKLMGATQRDGMGPIAPFAAFFTATAGLTVDLGKSIDVQVHLQAPTERSAALVAEAARTALTVGDLALDRARDELRAKPGKGNDHVKAFEEVLKKAGQALGKAVVTQTGTQVSVSVRMEVDNNLVATAVAEAARRVRLASEHKRHHHNLHQIAIAMHSYHDANKRFPHAGIGRGKDGKPLLSWRVAILPYIEHDNIYREFRLDEPWDSAHNKKLIEKMPSVYAAPGIDAKPGHTHYQGFVGRGTVFEPPQPNGPLDIRMAMITDGTSNTLMVVEAANPVIWTKPDDLPFDEKLPLPKLGGLYGDGFSAAFCDGSVRTLPGNLTEMVLRALITRNGGEAVSPDF